MIIETIAEYLIAIGGPDRGTWRVWLATTVVAIVACVVLAIFHLG